MRWQNKKGKGRIGGFIGGVVCLAFMFCLIQGMLFVRGDAQEAMWPVKERASVSGTAALAKKKVAYLTFDDGPSTLTAEYLKILKEEDVQATFFLIGQQLEGDMTEVAREAVEDGHEIGIHTYCHQAEQIYSSGQSYCEDLEKTRRCIEEKLEVTPKLFRFPWGSANSYVKNYKQEIVEYMKAEELDYADWNVSGEDSVGCPSAASILANVRKDYVKYDEPVILLHDSATCKQTLYALREIIRELKAAGYSFGTMSERKRPCHFGE